MLAQGNGGEGLLLIVVLAVGAWWFFKASGIFKGLLPGFWSGFWTRVFIGTLRTPSGSGWLERLARVLFYIVAVFLGLLILGLVAGGSHSG